MAKRPVLDCCDRCGGNAELHSLNAQVLAERIQECSLVYIQCQACLHRISSDDVLGANPGISELDKVLELVSVWNQQEYIFQLNAIVPVYERSYQRL